MPLLAVGLSMAEGGPRVRTASVPGALLWCS